MQALDPLANLGPSILGAHFDSSREYRKADLHLHSHFSYDVLNLPQLSPRALYDRAIKRGMGFFTLTDHETMRGILALERELEQEFGDAPPIPLIRGVEIKVRDERIGHTVHVNVLGLTQAQHLDLARRRKSIDAFLAYCAEHDLYHAYNHPFWFEKGERATLKTISELIRRFPLVELNAGRIPQLNQKTVAIARSFERQMVATSDSHTGQVAKAYTMAPGETADEFLRNIRRGCSVAVPSSASFRSFMDEVKATIDLVFVSQNAFEIKPTFLRSNPVARRIAAWTLRSERLMRPGRLKRGVAKSLQMMAHGPAYAFIFSQRRMNWRLGPLEREEAA